MSSPVTVRRTRLPILAVATAVVITMVTAPAARGERVEVERPREVSVMTKAVKFHRGKLIAYDEDGFDIRNDRGTTTTVAWKELRADDQYTLWRQLIGPKDADAHVELGRRMLHTPGGKEYADKAFAVALKLDPKLKGRVLGIRLAAVVKYGGQGHAGPQLVGAIQQRYWKPAEGAELKAAIAELKGFAEKTQKQMGVTLTLHETKYFLFYSDLSKEEAAKWAGLLDRMYNRLCVLFDVRRGTNVWRGRALIFVFREKADYVRFQKVMHDTDAAATMGICHMYGNGFVHVAFYRQPEELEFAHLLVHESVHGFIHRFKSHLSLPSWMDEGLAEWIANDLVPRKGRPEAVRARAKALMTQHGGLGTMLEAEHIEGWHYPVAEMLTTYLIEKRRTAYTSLVLGLKRGVPFDEATLVFGRSWENVLKEFMKAMAV